MASLCEETADVRQVIGELKRSLSQFDRRWANFEQVAELAIE